METWQLNYEGLLHGLETLTKNIEDTKLIAYLATNSTAGNELSLKKLALEFAGNYAILDEETPILSIPYKERLHYNLIDTLSTWYVYEKYLPIMIQDQQEDIYRDIFLPSVKSVVHMQLIGFPMDKAQIVKTNKELKKIHRKYINQLHNSKLIQEFEWQLQREAYVKKNQKLKRKVVSLDQFKTKLNPNSGQQVAKLLHEYLDLPILNTTDSGLPTTDKDTLQALYNHVVNQYELTEEDLK